MADEYRFPFQLLDDIDFFIHNEGSNETDGESGISLSELNRLCYPPINGEGDEYIGDVDPDVFLVNSLGLLVPDCKYYFPDTPEYILSPSHAKGFSVIHLNICSIPRNLDTFIDQCISPLRWRFDAIGFCETRLNNDIEHLYDIPLYTKFCNNHSRNSGGLALYLLDTYDGNVRLDLMYQEESIESLFVEIGCDFVVGVVYGRPNKNPGEFLEKFHDILERLKVERRKCYIMGDINLDLLKWETNIAVSDLVATCHSKLFFNSITKPTRVTDTSATLIDHIWSNDTLNNTSNGIVFTRISDHFPVFAIYKCDGIKVDDR